MILVYLNAMILVYLNAVIPTTTTKLAQFAILVFPLNHLLYFKLKSMALISPNTKSLRV